MAKTSQMDEQITHNIIDQHGLYARFGVDRMTVDRFTQIFYMVWKAAEDALDLTRNLRHALDPLDDGAAGSSASGAAMFLARRRFIFPTNTNPIRKLDLTIPSVFPDVMILAPITSWRQRALM